MFKKMDKLNPIIMHMAFPVGSDGKQPGFEPWDRKVPLEKGIATHSSILAWRIPWTVLSAKLQSMGLQRVGHDQATNTHVGILFPKRADC